MWTLITFGLTPFGSLQAGAQAERLGAPVALGLGAAVCVVAGLVTLITTPSLRGP